MLIMAFHTCFPLLMMLLKPRRWIYLPNVTGPSCCKSSSGCAGAGGLIRDSCGRMLAGFMASLGSCSSYKAELRAGVLSLRLVWQHGFKHVILEMNSAALVSVSRSSFGSMVLDPLSIQLLHRDWDSSKTWFKLWLGLR
jgi:hypothetical protein